MRILGLMTGTSVDAIDACLVTWADHGGGDLHATIEETHEWSWPGDLRERISDLVTGDAVVSMPELIDVDAQIGGAIGTACATLVDRDIDLIVSPGQTVFHHVRGARTIGTLALGDAARIHAATGIPVLTHVRSADIARGGTGAPLAPILDSLLAHSEAATVLNIGGIANVSSVGPGTEHAAGDTGPGNGLIDLVCRDRLGERFDVDGRLASTGRIRTSLLAALLSDPYFALPLPKSTGREYFSRAWLETRARTAGIDLGSCSTEDLLATLTELTAVSIAETVGALPPVLVHVTGGGAKNRTLMARLSAHLPERELRTGPIGGVDPDAKEAFLMALIGYLSAHGLPASLPHTTGATSSAVLGSLTPPTSFSFATRATMPRRLTVEVLS